MNAVAPPPADHRPPIVILSYNRPHYLEPVLESLLGQGAPPADARVHLFQDGPRGDIDDLALRAACMAAFRRAFPGGTVHEAQANLGIAFNFDRAERFVFETLNAEVAYFFEDDLLLAPHYLAALDQLSEFALREEQVGYVAAYGAHQANEETAARRNRDIVALHHNWGFALTRRHWLRIRPMVERYLDLLRGRPYRLRDETRIRDHYRALGSALQATSQDAAKRFAGVLAGSVDLMCHACYGHYIGRVGEHFNEKVYLALGFADTRLRDAPPPTFVWPDQTALTEIRLQHARWADLVSKAPLPGAQPAPAWPLSPADFVTEAYRGVLQRDPDPGGLEAHQRLLAQPGRTPADVLRSLTRSAEFRGKLAVHMPAPPPPPPSQPAHSALMQALHGGNVYDGFVPDRACDLQGWNSVHRCFREEIATRRPRLVVDVGVRKGASTIHLAHTLRTEGVSGQVLAVDTFLGSPEEWKRDRSDRIREHLGNRHGMPQLYWQFLSNVVHQGCTDIVVPLPQTSENAAVILAGLGVRPGLVHIDAAHEYATVLRDAGLWWDLLVPGGILIGDDFTWPGVAQAAREFAAAQGIDLRVDHPKWMLAKPMP